MAVALVISGTIYALLSALMTAGALRTAVFLGIALWLGFGVFAILGLIAWAKIRANPWYLGWFPWSKRANQLAFSGLWPHI